MEFVLKNRLNFCIKISFIILKNIQQDEWTGAKVFNTSKTLPKDMREFFMSLGINPNAFLSASATVRSFLLEVNQSNLDWVEPQAVEPDVKGEQVVRSPPGKKRKALASIGQNKKKKAAHQISLRTLINEPDEFDISFDQSSLREKSEVSAHASTLFISLPLQPLSIIPSSKKGMSPFLRG